MGLLAWFIGVIIIAIGMTIKERIDMRRRERTQVKEFVQDNMKSLR